MKTSGLLLLPALSLPALAQGPLDPPAGPPAPSMKTLNEIHSAISGTRTAVDQQAVHTNKGTPITTNSGTYVISASGTYFLTSNRTAPNGAASIIISAPDVVLDLNGFTITGSTSTSRGVSISSAYTNQTVRNGTIRGCAGAVLAGSSGNSGIVIEKVNALECTGRILEVVSYSRISDCIVTGATGATEGIRVWDDCIVENCQIIMPDGWGIQGFSGTGLTIRGCNIGGTASVGISVARGSLVENCNVTGVTSSTGIRTHDHCRIVDCTSTRSTGGGGIVTGATNLLSGCEVSGNTGSSDYTAIFLGTGSQAVNCLSANNVCTSGSLNQFSGIGFYATTNCVIDNCIATGNTGAGVLVAGNGAIITRNNLSGNGAGSGVGAGIQVLNTCMMNRIEGNHLIGNKTGIFLLAGSSKNIVTRNTVGGNVTNNWNVGANNHVAPVVAAATATAFTGNTGGAALGSTDPNANFTLP